jgi:tripartite-type tricarboxylate transporter receptor subunit TctC
VQEKLHKLGLTAVGSTSAEFAAFVKSETARWREVVKANHISLQ